MLRSQHRVYDDSGEVARTQDVWGAEGISGRVKFLPLAWAGMPKTSFRKNSDSPPLQFSTQELEALLSDVNLSVLQEVLRRLSSSPVLEGIVSKKNQFVFANNLFPTWLKYTQGRVS